MPDTIDTTPTEQDWKAYAGDANVEPFEFLLDGMPWDLTGAVVTAQARKTRADAAVSLTASITAVDATLGQYLVGWDGEAVRTLLGASESWVGVWDLQVLLLGEALPTTYRTGKFTALLDVTRP